MEPWTLACHLTRLPIQRERAALEPHVPTWQIIVREQLLNRRSAGPTVRDYFGEDQRSSPRGRTFDGCE
jgi:hypothetical protein